MQTKILVVDNEKDFYSFVSETITNRMGESNGIEIKWIVCSDDIPNENFDLYLVDNGCNGNSYGLKIIEKIKDKDPNHTTYVVSECGNFDFLKILFKEKVSGFIDKNDDDFEQIFEAIDVMREIKQIRFDLLQKLEEIQV